MSIKAVSWAIEVRVGDPTLKVLLIAIANYADENNRAWPSQKRLAYDTEVSERTIRRKMNELQDLGLISIEERRRPSGEVATSVVTLNTSGQSGRLSQPADKIDPTIGQKRGSPSATKVSASNEPSRTIKEEPSDSIPSLSLGHASNGTELNLEPSCEAKVLTKREEAELFFDKQFWPNYPKRFGSNPKELARKKIISAILKGENPTEILDGVHRLFAGLQRGGKIGTEYVPMAITWINRRQWKDDPLPAGNGKARGEVSFFDVAQEAFEQAHDPRSHQGGW